MDSAACDDQFALGVAERFESFLENFTSHGSIDGATTDDETLHDYLEQAVCVCAVCVLAGGGFCASLSLRTTATAVHTNALDFDVLWPMNKNRQCNYQRRSLLRQPVIPILLLLLTILSPLTFIFPRSARTCAAPIVRLCM